MTGGDTDNTAATPDTPPIEELKIATTSHDNLLNGGPRDKNGKPRKAFANWLYAVVFIVVDMAAVLIMQTGVTENSTRVKLSSPLLGAWSIVGKMFTNLNFVFVLNLILVGLFYLALLMLTNRIWVASPIVLALASVIAVADHFKVESRYEAILPSDMNFLQSNTGDIVSFIPTGSTGLIAGVVIGIVGYGMAKAGAIEMFGSASAAETLIPAVAQLIAQNGALFAILAGVLLAGILAATMSTADAQLLAAASGVTHNLLTDVFGVKMSDKKTMFIARIAVICIAILGILFALDPESSIFKIVSFAWAGFGATFGPVMLFGLFWKRCNRFGAIAGMFGGAATVFVWKYAIAPLGGILGIYELLPAFVVSSLLIVVVSLLTPAPDAEITAEFDAVKAAK